MTGLNLLGSTDAPARGSDRLRRDVGLLGGDPAVLDREVGRVASRVDALQALHLAVHVDVDEAVASRRESRGCPGARRARAARRRDRRRAFGRPEQC